MPIGPPVSIAGSRTRRAAPRCSQFVHEVQHVPGGPSQPVELHDHQRVAGADEGHDGLKLAAAVSGLARRLLGSNDGAPRIPQLGLLDVGVLIGGGDAGVAEEGWAVG